MLKGNETPKKTQILRFVLNCGESELLYPSLNSTESCCSDTMLLVFNQKCMKSADVMQQFADVLSSPVGNSRVKQVVCAFNECVS